MKHLDLFSGIGGFALAAKWADIETIAFCEIDPFCRKVLKKHWPGILKYMDIRDIDNPDHVDILTAGMPCQPFSIAGKKRGYKDERYLWPETLRVIKRSRSNWIILENVIGMVAVALDDIITDLENEGYETRSFIIPACAANAPHRRDRVWIIANRHGERCNERVDHRQKRYIQTHEKWNVAQVQSEWEKLKPEPWKTMQARGWLALNAHAGKIDDGISARMARLKSFGNAIVPQIAYALMMIIKRIEKHD
jgi:DNA (cytosine-5)-methyltransferase 1